MWGSLTIPCDATGLSWPVADWKIAKCEAALSQHWLQHIGIWMQINVHEFYVNAICYLQRWQRRRRRPRRLRLLRRPVLRVSQHLRISIDLGSHWSYVTLAKDEHFIIVTKMGACRSVVMLMYLFIEVPGIYVECIWKTIPSEKLEDSVQYLYLATCKTYKRVLCGADVASTILLSYTGNPQLPFIQVT